MSLGSFLSSYFEPHNDIRYKNAPIVGSPIGSLHMDVLVFILSFTLKSYRLLVLSFVCKRWRKAALLSVTSLRGVSRDRLPQMLHLYSALTALHPDGANPVGQPLTFPPRLQTLKLDFYTPLQRQHRPSDCLLLHFTSLSTLTSLDTYAHPGCVSLLPLLTASRTTLASLTLRIRDQPNGPTQDFLNETHFPALVHLTYENAEDFLPFIRRHSTQLTSFEYFGSVRDEVTADMFKGATFPRLVRLSLHGNRIPYMPALLCACSPSIRLAASRFSQSLVRAQPNSKDIIMEDEQHESPFWP